MKSLGHAKRLDAIPSYLFDDLDKARDARLAQGADVVDLGVGDPDLSTPREVCEALAADVTSVCRHGYPSYTGLISFREAVAGYYQERFGVQLDAQTEALSLIGSKEGLAHLPLALVDPGDVALVPDPEYPVYRNGVLLANGVPYDLPLAAENDFLPVLQDIPPDVLKRARLMYLNYPNNPTAAVAPLGYLASVVDFCRENSIYLCYDNAYSEVYFGEEKPHSVLEIPAARDIAVEVGSLSKSFNMTGWRIGFMVGSRHILAALGKVKMNIDSGVFESVQRAGVIALGLPESVRHEIRAVYRHRRDLMVKALTAAGWKVRPPEATFYIWAPVPPGWSSADFARRMLEEIDVLVTPGSGFGRSGEGYVRFSLTSSNERIEEAAARIQGWSVTGLTAGA